MKRLGLTPLSTPSLAQRGLPDNPQTGPRPKAPAAVQGSNRTRPNLGCPEITNTRQIVGEGMVSLVWPSVRLGKGRDPTRVAEEIAEALDMDTYQAEWVEASDRNRKGLGFQVETEKIRELDLSIPLIVGRTGGYVLGITTSQRQVTLNPTMQGQSPLTPKAEEKKGQKAPFNRQKGKGWKVTFTSSPLSDACAFCGSQSYEESTCTQHLIRVASMHQALRREEELG